jgi:hypothetical protein
MHQLQPAAAGGYTINYTPKQADLIYRVTSREEMPNDRRLWGSGGGPNGDPSTLRFGGNLGLNKSNEFSSSYTTMYRDTSLESVERQRQRHEANLRRARERQARVDELNRALEEKRQRRAEERQRRQQQKMMMELGATAVQAQARGFLSRRRVGRIRAERRVIAATQIQKTHRGRLGRQRHRKRHERVHGAAGRIQRGWKDRVEYLERREKARAERKVLIEKRRIEDERRRVEFSAAQKVQKMQRGRAGRHRAARIKAQKIAEAKRIAEEEERRRKELIARFEAEQASATGKNRKKKKKRKGKSKGSRANKQASKRSLKL